MVGHRQIKKKKKLSMALNLILGQKQAMNKHVHCKVPDAIINLSDAVKSSQTGKDLENSTTQECYASATPVELLCFVNLPLKEVLSGSAVQVSQILIFNFSHFMRKIKSVYECLRASTVR